MQNKCRLDLLLLGLFLKLSTLWNSILCRGVVVVSDRTWLDAGSVWLKVAPFGIRRLLNFIKNEYGNPPIIITENGVSERGPVDLKDGHRTYFYEKYINEVLKGIKASHSKKSKSRNGFRFVFLFPLNKNTDVLCVIWMLSNYSALSFKVRKIICPSLYSLLA